MPVKGIRMQLLMVDAGEPGDMVATPETVATDERPGAGISADGENDVVVSDPQDSPLVERHRYSSDAEYVPTPAEIKATCRVIRADWTTGERFRRLTGRWDEVDE